MTLIRKTKPTETEKPQWLKDLDDLKKKLDEQEKLLGQLEKSTNDLEAHAKIQTEKLNEISQGVTETGIKAKVADASIDEPKKEEADITDKNEELTEKIEETK